MPLRNKRKRSTAATPPLGPKQQQISSMFGERVTKPRTAVNDEMNQAKRQKVESPPSRMLPTPTLPTKIVSSAGIQAQKRKHRLSEILKKERESRLQRSTGTPAFVFQPPHIDSRRPKHPSSPVQQPNEKNVRGLRLGGAGRKGNAEQAVRKRNSSFNVTADAPGLRTHGSMAAPGGEALMYSRSMMPESHQLLLDVLSGMEAAVSLLKTRRTLPTIAAVGEIVRRSTRREFNLRIVSQLAHIVPEAVAVLPGLPTSKTPKRPSDNLIIRLDDVDAPEDGNAVTQVGKAGPKMSKLGTTVALLRRSLLHKRLLRHVNDSHILFLKKEGIKDHHRDSWHPKFDLERDVQELPAPPLYPKQLIERPKDASVAKGQGNEIKLKIPAGQTLCNEDATTSTVIDDQADSGEDEEDSCIPRGLLQKVRARKEARDSHQSKVEIEKAANTSLLSKLPCTMDSICTVLRGERRSAMGWSQLLDRVGKMHPKKWPKDDLDKQFTAITRIGSDWCKKHELKSSRGGFAFRVISESSFAKARAAVSTATSYNEDAH
eukprot:GFKZ01011467.1.p1 GENE.GFKZ01011467.1~~GFKZ01011467.1.p1  ORF type:complete len:545 (+),score=75.29 GFKZ01011467.1:256-1890(+)